MNARKQFDLTGNWASTYEAIVSMMETGIADPRFDELAEGPSSNRGIEKFARTICEYDQRADLGITYALAAVAVSTAAQGGFVLVCPVALGGKLEVPVVSHMFGVARSGWRKSSAIKAVQAPLDDALAMGERQRRDRLAELIAEAKDTARGDMSIDGQIDDKQFTEVFTKGLCSHTIVSDATVETLRNMVVNNGGVVSVLAAEADTLRNVTQYSAPGASASLTIFLDLWDQARVSTGRVGAGMMVMDEAVLQMAVLFQTDVFAEVTGGTNGADSFMARGMFGRIWVVETEKTGGWEEIAELYGDDVVHTDSDNSEPTSLDLAVYDYTRMLQDLVADSNEYRMFKALAHAWKASATKLGDELQVPEIYAQPRRKLTLTPSAQQAYNRLQRLYNAIEKALDDMDEDAQTMWGPLASRYVQHVMREAVIITLSSGSDEVTAETIQDAATRVVPWRWAATTRALSKRTQDRVEDIVEKAARDNRADVDLTIEGRIIRAMSKMTMADEQHRALGWPQGEITRKIIDAIPRADRKGGVRLTISKTLEKMSQDPESGITMLDGGVNPVNKKPIVKYTINQETLIFG